MHDSRMRYCDDVGYICNFKLWAYFTVAPITCRIIPSLRLKI